MSSVHGSKQEQSCAPATPKPQRSGTRGLLGLAGCKPYSRYSEKLCLKEIMCREGDEHPKFSSGLCRHSCAHIHTHLHHKHTYTEVEHFCVGEYT